MFNLHRLFKLQKYLLVLIFGAFLMWFATQAYISYALKPSIYYVGTAQLLIMNVSQYFPMVLLSLFAMLFLTICIQATICKESKMFRALINVSIVLCFVVVFLNGCANSIFNIPNTLSPLEIGVIVSSISYIIATYILPYRKIKIFSIILIAATLTHAIYANFSIDQFRLRPRIMVINGVYIENNILREDYYKQDEKTDQPQENYQLQFERLVRLLKESEDAYVRNNLANLYADGHGVKKDISKALELYHQSDKEGDNYATYNIGLIYELGDGIKANPKLAAKYYERASLHSNYCASNDLGRLYAKGIGVPQNDELAMKYFQLATKAENIVLVVHDKPPFKQVFVINNFDEVYAKYRLTTLKNKSINYLDADTKRAVMFFSHFLQEDCRGN